jgi:hypothetical protein
MKDKELEIQEEADAIADAILAEEDSDSLVEELEAEESALDEDTTDLDEETNEEYEEYTEETEAPSSKMGMINNMIKSMNEMSKDDLAKSFDALTAALSEEADEEEEEDDLEKDGDEDYGDDKKKKKLPFMKEKKKVAKEDFDFSSDVEVLVGDENLSEEYKTTVTTIYEAAVVSKVNEILESITTDYEKEIAEETDAGLVALADKMEEYLDFAIEGWSKHNEVAIESAVRSEITENFMVGLRNLFAESYIDIPEEKIDFVDELANKVGELEEDVNGEMEKNIELSNELVEMKKEKALREVSESLTQTQAAKLDSLSEGVDYVDFDSYVEKLSTLKENYFSSTKVETDDSELEEFTEEAGADTIPAHMKPYMSAISRSTKK